MKFQNISSSESRIAHADKRTDGRTWRVIWPLFALRKPVKCVCFK